MLFAFVICSTFALCTATPLHKYPYVFLLDIGNEELEKTNTEQIRVSVPGGSLAMKYPAIGEGDPISHVRVSGIDFGTDLKVNIIEGGPGYNYVVLMFTGNSGVTYDAVVTLQTLKTVPRGTEINLISTKKIDTTEKFVVNPYEISEPDSDDNDQDSVNDMKNMKQYSKKSKEVMQSTSAFYNYAKSEMDDGVEDKETENVSAEEEDDNDDDDSADEEDKEEDEFSNKGDQRFFNEDHLEPTYQDERKISDSDENENKEDESFKRKLYSRQNFNQFTDIPRAEQYRYNVNLNNADNAKPDRYQDITQRFGLGFRVYPQSFIYNRQYQGNSGNSKEDPAEFEQVFNNEDAPNDSRFKDDRNNIDSDYLVAEY